ncbi:Uncharacterised protein [Yersinia aldovae]|nr:Uncharacterised protein [Yersinia aldovae]
MGRKPMDTTVIPDTDPQVITGADAHFPVSRTPASLAEKEAAEADERDLLNQLLGQAQIAGASEDFFRTVRTSKLAFVKENKLYRQLKGSRNPHSAEFLSGTWEEFCSILGRSVDQVDRDITNLRTFGEEALDSMSRMGIGYREMRQYRKLPDDQRLALIEAAKEGDKTLLLDLAEDLISKHIKEKESITKEVEDIKTDLDISRQALAEKKEQLDQSREDNSALQDKLKFRVARETPEAEGAQIVQDVSILQHAVIADLMNLERGLTALADHTERTGIIHHSLMGGILGDIETRITVLRQQFNLPDYVPYDPRPDWVAEAEKVNLDDKDNSHELK